MGIFFAVLVVLVVIAKGVEAVSNTFSSKKKQIMGDTPQSDINPVIPVKSSRKDTHLDILINVLNNEGYMGHVKLKDEDILPVRNTIISTMIETVALSGNLIWKAPQYRLRIREMDDTLKMELGVGYSHMLLTPTHAIGFNLPQESV